MGEKLDVVFTGSGQWEVWRGATFIATVADERHAHLLAGAPWLKAAADKLIPTLRRRNGWLTELPDKFLDADEELEAAAKSCEPPEVNETEPPPAVTDDDAEVPGTGGD